MKEVLDHSVPPNEHVLSAPANGAIITASGFFYTLVRFAQDHMPAEWQGGGKYAISSGGVIEPKGAEG